MTTQLITPDPNIPCRPGYCLEYVRETFALPIRYGSATEAWNNSPSQHQDWNFPAGLWVPIYFAIDIEPNGHIALRVPDGTIWSSSDLTNVPHHHPSIDDLIAYYARWGKMQLTYLGWTEDVAGYPVVSSDSGSINFDSITPTAQETEVVTDDDVLRIAKAAVALIMTEQHGGNTLGELIAEERPHYLSLVAQTTKPQINANQAEDIVQAVVKRVPSAVLNANVPLSGGANATLAWVLDAVNSKPSGTSVAASVDVDALVARLKNELPAAILPAIAAKLTS